MCAECGWPKRDNFRRGPWVPILHPFGSHKNVSDLREIYW
ncbi:hypothetical protein MTR67_012045 [Solanum verrucosum]|uniref:Uncharacterized protein n=1 Tax=Solanum verrucosum TaxID=315347 RepID=A0AAF0QC94_SOLVR|nr:hypothetical protein MTR67_012045 [Solanum verrucosum]